MQTHKPEEQHNVLPEQEREGFPWKRLTLVTLVLIFIAIVATLLIYVNAGAAILFAIISIVGLILAFLQVVPTLFPPKKSQPLQLPPIIIQTPLTQSVSPPSPSATSIVVHHQS